MKSLVFFLTFISMSVQASTVARVLEIKGKAFAFNGQKNPTTLKYGDQIEDLSDIMVEDSSYLSVVDTEGHIFHITGGTLVKLYKQNLELKNGQVWTVARDKYKKASVTTTNAMVEYNQGQFVTSFDNISGKTQVLVITGDVKLANVLEPKLFTPVTAGHFSIVDPQYENNLPRSPTRVGAESFGKLRAEFAGFETLNNPQLDKMLPSSKKSPTAGRTIASVIGKFTGKSVGKKKGKIIRIYTGTAQRTPASAMGYYLKVKKTKGAQTQMKVPTAKVNYYGWKPKQVIKTNQVQSKIEQPTYLKTPQVRMPASIPQPVKSPPQGLIQDLKKSQFEKNYQQKSQTIKRHSDEVNYLIDNLKSYRKDYRKGY